jgi:hypothetical protein
MRHDLGDDAEGVNRKTDAIETVDCPAGNEEVELYAIRSVKEPCYSESLVPTVFQL